MSDYTTYIRGFFYYMGLKLDTIIEGLRTGDTQLRHIVRFIVLSKLLNALEDYDSTEGDDNAYTTAQYRQIQNLLNKYLKINNTYNGFDYSTE